MNILVVVVQIEEMLTHFEIQNKAYAIYISVFHIPDIDSRNPICEIEISNNLIMCCRGCIRNIEAFL